VQGFGKLNWEPSADQERKHKRCTGRIRESFGVGKNREIKERLCKSERMVKWTLHEQNSNSGKKGNDYGLGENNSGDLLNRLN